MTTWTDFLGAEVRWLDVDGVPTRVVIMGEGDATLVLLHGRGGHLESWRRNACALAAGGHRVVAFDLLGHGLTGRHEGGYGVADLVAHAAATLDELAISGATLVGQSIGGWVAVELALRRSDLAAALVLVEPAGLQSERERLADPMVAAAYARGGKAFEEPTVDAVRDRLLGLFADPDRIDDELVALRQALYAPAEARAVHRAVRAADNTTLVLTPRRLACLRLPTLLIHGERANTPDDVIAAAAAAAGARLVVVPDTKQWPHYEAPAAVNDLILSFNDNNEV